MSRAQVLRDLRRGANGSTVDDFLRWRVANVGARPGSAVDEDTAVILAFDAALRVVAAKSDDQTRGDAIAAFVRGLRARRVHEGDVGFWFRVACRSLGIPE